MPFNFTIPPTLVQHAWLFIVAARHLANDLSGGDREKADALMMDAIEKAREQWESMGEPVKELEFTLAEAFLVDRECPIAPPSKILERDASLAGLAYRINQMDARLKEVERWQDREDT